jgi:hypothetical protein
MKQLLTIGIVFCLTLLLFGCGSQGSGTASYNFKQGIVELQVNLIDGAPPEKIYPQSSFKMVLEVDNQLAYEVHDGEIFITGLDPKYFFIEQQDNYFGPLQGKSMLSPAGEKDFLDFSGRSGKIFSNAIEQVNNYYVWTTYSSRVEFSDTLCINPNLYEVYDSGCKVETHKSYSGQGAPLAIAELEEIIYPPDNSRGEVEFRFRVINKGSGKVTDKVRLVKAELGGVDLSCKFQNGVEDKETIVFNDQEQEATLVCKAPIRGGVSYTTTMFLELSYNYKHEDLHTLRLINPDASRSAVWG